MKPMLLALILAGSLMAEQRYAEGNARSSVRVIVYEDLQCSDCARYRKMMDEQLLPKFGQKVAFEHRDFPLPKHSWARQAAILARHFEITGGEMSVRWRQFALINLREITPENFREWLAKFCELNGADFPRAWAAMQDARIAALVDRDYQEGVARGIARTPTVLVNGRPFIENFEFEEIAQAIDEALKEAAR